MILGHLNKYLIFRRLITDLKKFGKKMKYPKTGIFDENRLRSISQILDLLKINTKMF